MEIKICGLTRPEEAHYLNQAQVDYAGFVVFFPQSKRYVTIDQAKTIIQELEDSVKRVAVTVSPTVEQVHTINEAGFDILQVHGELSRDVLKITGLPVWYAFNVSDFKELEEKQAFLSRLPKELADKIQGIVVDSSNYGSGVTFDWEKSQYLAKSKGLKKAGTQSPPQYEDKGAISDIFANRRFILAGGLREENVAESIRLFEPDIVDVSSGVEGEHGKDRKRVNAFVECVRNGAQ